MMMMMTMMTTTMMMTTTTMMMMMMTRRGMSRRDPLGCNAAGQLVENVGKLGKI